MTKTTRNINKELLHHVYYDMRDGSDEDRIDNDCLIGLLTEIVSRMESIEQRLDGLELVGDPQ